ncbi:MAG: hypothetical protein AAF501_11320 [Pseudomonadota bacterium]
MTDDTNRGRHEPPVEDPGIDAASAPDGRREPPVRAVNRNRAPSEMDREDAMMRSTPGGGDEPEYELPPERPGEQPQPARRKGAKQRRGKQGQRSALPALRKEMQSDTPALRAERVEAIRRDLIKRRRKKGGGLLARLLFFVIIPTLAVAWFLWERATPFYESVSTFTVQSADGGIAGSSGGFVGKFLGGKEGGNDPIAVQSFIMSRDVLRRLDMEQGFIAHFQEPSLDFWHRLDADASFEDSFSHYERMVNVSFDPSEGVLDMTVRAATPEDSQRFSKAIISYAEEMVDQLSDRIREATLRDAESSMQSAEDRLEKAHLEQAQLRESLDIFSVEVEVKKEMEIISAMEVELEQLTGKLRNLLRVTSDEDPRVQRITNQVATLQDQIAARQEKITGSKGDRQSLADRNTQLQQAEFEVTAAMTIFTATIEAHEAAKQDIVRQHRYLAAIVSPSLPDEARYPKKIQTTALAFLVFLGAYILLSLTFSLIREQASI